MSFEYPISIHTCYYHARCPDGVCAAWAIRKRTANQLNDCKYIGIAAGGKYLKDTDYTDKVVMFVDVCPNEKSLKDMLDKATMIYILDHHVTNRDLVEKYKDHVKLKNHVVFDMERSGCQIAWDYISNVDSLATHPRLDQTRLWFINCVGTDDLWKHKEYENSKGIVSAMCDYEYFNFEKLDELYSLEDNGLSLVETKFLPYIEKVDIKNKLILKNDTERAAPATLTLIEDKQLSESELEFIKDNIVIGRKYKVWVGTTIGHLISSFGNILANKTFDEDKVAFGNNMPDFAVVYTYDHWKDGWKYALRSIAPFDVSKIAAKFGGGGHAQASGFTSKKGPRELFSFTDIEWSKNAIYT